MQPEDKLAITFVVLCIFTVGSALMLAYVFGCVYYLLLWYTCVNLINPVISSILPESVTSTLLEYDNNYMFLGVIFFYLGQLIAWFPVLKQVHRLYLCYLTFKDVEKGKAFDEKSAHNDKNNLQSSSFWCSSATDALKFFVDEKTNQLYLKGIFLNELVNVDVTVTSSIVADIHSNKLPVPSTSYWCLCWRKRKRSRNVKIIQWSDKSNRDYGTMNDGKTAWFMDADGIKVIVDTKRIESLCPPSDASNTSTEKRIDEEWNDSNVQGLGLSLNVRIEHPSNYKLSLSSTHLHIEYVSFNLNFKNASAFNNLDDINVVQNGFGTFSKSVLMKASSKFLTPLCSWPGWRILIAGVVHNLDNPYFFAFCTGITSEHCIGFVNKKMSVPEDNGFFLGFVSQLNGLGSFYFDQTSYNLDCNLEYFKTIAPGSTLACEPLLLFKGRIDQNFMEKFANLVADKHKVRFKQRSISTDARSVPLGWCSWYEFYSNVDEEKVMRNVEFLNKNSNAIKKHCHDMKKLSSVELDNNNGINLPSVDFIQLDDGYQYNIGDWLNFREKKFPNGLEGLAKKIKKKGYKAGIWVAPFMCGAYSKIAKEHDDEWFLKYKPSCKYREDSLISIAFDILFRFKFFKLLYLFDVFGSNTNGNVIGHFNPEWENDLGVIYVLDYTNPEVQKYITNVFKTLRAYGFEYFKIDFLTCGIRDGVRYNNNMTRLEVYRMSLKLIRDAIGPDAFLLGKFSPFTLRLSLGHN
jgi:hypothetical protein